MFSLTEYCLWYVCIIKLCSHNQIKINFNYLFTNLKYLKLNNYTHEFSKMHLKLSSLTYLNINLLLSIKYNIYCFTYLLYRYVCHVLGATVDGSGFDSSSRMKVRANLHKTRTLDIIATCSLIVVFLQDQQ